MKQGNFENLEIRTLAIKLTKKLADVFYSKNFKSYSFQDQIMRAAISISNNIAEGNERGYKQEFIKFLLIAKGSYGEIRNMLILAKEFNYIEVKQKDDFI